MLATLALVLVSSQASQDLLGADKVLGALKTGVSRPSPESPFHRIQREIDSFNARSGSLSAQAAADGWLKLWKDWQVAAADPSAHVNAPEGFDQSARILVTALPRPETWPIIRAALTKQATDKQSRPLVVLFDLLVGDEQEVIRKLERMRKPPEEGVPPGMDFGAEAISKVELPLAIRTGNIDLAQRLLVESSRSPTAFFFDGVPDIVGLFGAEKARPILKQMLEAATGQFHKINGAETRKLALSIMLADLSKIKVPQWSVVEGPGTAQTVATLIARFGVKSLEEDRSSSNAGAIYVLNLIEKGKNAEAIEFLSKNGLSYYGVVAELDVARSVALFAVLSQVFDKAPGADAWEAYISLAKKTGKLPEARRRMDGLLANPELKTDARRTILAQKAELLAEEGDEKGAIGNLIEASRLPANRQSVDRVLDNLLALVAATGNREALDAAVKAAEETDANSYSASGVFDLLVQQGRLADAQRHVLKMAVKLPSRFSEGEAPPETPVLLAELYFLANRPQDIVDLLDNYPKWRAKDLSEVLLLRKNRNYRQEFWRGPLGFYAAWAFSKTDRKELAIRILRSVLSSDMEEDRSYQLLNELEGEPALAFYDGLIKSDAFEARPLAWKADLLLRLGRLSEAEKTARMAVALAPSDGQSGAGRRMASYGVLGRVLRAQGNATEADLYERAVKAVRISEKADLYRDAGLLPQAVATYRESAEVFSGAYCVQARMALTLAQQGKMPEALEHFKRAFELMPDSFGKMETMCIGCEGTFASDAQRGLALSVFERLAKEFPTKAQVPYLLGLLKEETEDYKGALASFVEAVRLDPQYLNAWKEIVDLADQGVVSKALLDEAAVTLVRLDPMARHGTYQAARHVSSYAALWRIYTAAAASLPPAPTGPLYPLRQAPNEGRGMFPGMGAVQLRKSPSFGLSELEVIRDIFSLRTWSD
jgi:tetratricopeptide (TPR) repeat protein